jgi:hypothetical protein
MQRSISKPKRLYPLLPGIKINFLVGKLTERIGKRPLWTSLELQRANTNWLADKQLVIAKPSSS